MTCRIYLTNFSSYGQNLMTTLTLLPRVLEVIIENYAITNNYLQELLDNTLVTYYDSIIWQPTGVSLNFGDLRFDTRSYRVYLPSWDISNFSGTVVAKIPRRYIYSLIECDYN